jgi:hypothetical protein
MLRMAAPARAHCFSISSGKTSWPARARRCSIRTATLPNWRSPRPPRPALPQVPGGCRQAMACRTRGRPAAGATQGSAPSRYFIFKRNIPFDRRSLVNSALGRAVLAARDMAAEAAVRQLSIADITLSSSRLIPVLEAHQNERAQHLRRRQAATAACRLLQTAHQIAPNKGPPIKRNVPFENEVAGGITLIHVPYRGAAPAVTDLLAGQVQVMFDNAASSAGHVRAGRLRALAGSSDFRRLKRWRTRNGCRQAAKPGHPHGTMRTLQRKAGDNGRRLNSWNLR